MSDNNNINVALTLDQNYVVPIAVLMTSILENLSKDYSITFYMFVSGFTDKDRSTIEEIKKVRDFEVVYFEMEKYTHLFEEVNVDTFRNQYINIVCYYRLLLFKILPENVKKIFYIDGDMIVDTDLSEIYQTVDGMLASLVVEVIAMTYRDSGLKHLYGYEEYSNFVKNPNLYPYYNAGFELLNIEMARELKLWEKAWEFFHNHPNPPYADQDIINAIIGQANREKVYILGPEYNVFCTNDINHEYGHDNAYYPRIATVDAYSNPKILHYAGPDKPWLNSRGFYYDIWWDYALRTPIKDEIILMAKNSIKKITSKMDTNNHTENNGNSMCWSRRQCVFTFAYITLTNKPGVRQEYEKYLTTLPPQRPGLIGSLLRYQRKILKLLILNLQK